MKLSHVSTKLIYEVIRLKTEYSMSVCTVPMLISALFAIRDENEFTNLFNAYFEKKLGIKFDVIDKVIDELINAGKQASVSKSDMQLQPKSTSTPITISTNNELSDIFEHLANFLSECQRVEITPDYFIVSLFETGASSIRRFLKKISVNYMEAEMFFERKKILDYEIVPYEISHFVTYSNPQYVGKPCHIVGREKELKEIYRNMLKPVKRNVILYGFPGVGKTAVGELLKHNISNNLCPNHFKGFKIFEMSVKDFLLNCNDSKEANEMMNTLLNFLSKRKDDIILLIDEIQTILGKGGLFDPKKLDLSTTLKPILVRGDVRIVGMTTFTDYLSFKHDQALDRRFAGINIIAPKMKQVPAMITPMIREIEKEKQMQISVEVIDKAIWYAACFDFNKHNPDKSLDVVNGAIANAQLRNSNTLTVNDVINVFHVSFERWEGMTTRVKKGIAYHEAGHYVLNVLTNPGNYVVLAVSIYPTKEYNGVNVLEVDETVTPNTNKEYFYNEIACDLAGRVAEELVFGDINSGASEDLDSATAIAQSMITEFGMSDGIGKNRVYLNEGLGNDEGAQEVDEEVSEIINLVYKRCKKILIENRDFLDAIAHALLEHHILMKSELDEIWENVKKERLQNPTSLPKRSKNTQHQEIEKFKKFGKSTQRNLKRLTQKARRTVKKHIRKFHK